MVARRGTLKYGIVSSRPRHEGHGRCKVCGSSLPLHKSVSKRKGSYKDRYTTKLEITTLIHDYFNKDAAFVSS